MRKEIGDLQAALAVLLERALAAQEPRVGPDERILRFTELVWLLLPVELIEERLGIEGVDVARAPRHEQEDDRLRLCRPRRRLCRQWIGPRLVLRHQRGQRQRAEAAEG